ncbi:MAG TPA: DUF6263 family protein [Gemmataceae bacterium]|nr:DUF6263 family protein [Gemmataceae bacterium]
MFFGAIRKAWLGTFVVVLVCAGSSPAGAQTTLSYKFKEGEKLGYTIEQKIEMQMNVMGNNVEMKVLQTLDTTWNVVSVDKDKKAKISQKIDRIRFSMEGGPTGKIDYDSKDGKKPEGQLGEMVGPIFEAMTSADFGFTMDAHGKIADVQVPEKLTEALKKLPAGSNQMFSADTMKQMVEQGGIVLPGGAVEKGKSWEQKSEMEAPFGKMVITKSLTDEGTAMINGKEVEKIALKPMVSLEADPNKPFTVKIKAQEGKGTAYFDNASGHLVESTTTQTMEMAIAAGGAQFEQKMTQTGSMKLRQDKQK